MSIPNRTPEIYTKLCESYDAVPGNHILAGQRAGIDPRSAKKCWDRGWTDQLSIAWAPPIKNRARDIKAQARTIVAQKQAERVEETTELLTTAAQQAARAYANEALVLEDVRIGTGHLAKQFVALGTVLEKLTTRCATEVQKIVDAPGDFDVERALGILEASSKFNNRNVGTLRLVMEAERLHLGAPGEVIRHEHTVVLSPEQAKAQVQALAADWEFDVTPKALPPKGKNSE